MSMMGHNQRSVQGLTEEDRAALRKAVIELSDSMTRIEAERSLQKETVSDITERLGVDKRMFRRMARTYFKATFKSEVEENTEFEEFYSTVMED